MQIISISKLNGYDLIKVKYEDDIFERWVDYDDINSEWSILTRPYGVMVTELEKEFQIEYKKYLRKLKLERIANGI